MANSLLVAEHAIGGVIMARFVAASGYGWKNGARATALFSLLLK